MTNDEIRMSNEARNPNDEIALDRDLQSFELRHSLDISALAFDIPQWEFRT